jgi:hypothetical protein
MPRPYNTIWIRYSIAAAIHFFKGRDGKAWVFQREIAEHTTISLATITTYLGLMDKIGWIKYQRGPRNGSGPGSYEILPAFPITFPRLSPYNKALVRRVCSWELKPGVRIRKTGANAGEKWHTSSPQSQNWYLRLHAFHAVPSVDGFDEIQLSLEQLALMGGFKKATKQANSEVALLAKDLEAAGRITRDRRDENKKCTITVQRLAGESGFVPGYDGSAEIEPDAWPPPPAETNAAKVFARIYRETGGLNRTWKGWHEDFAPDFPHLNAKNAKRAAARGIERLKELGILKYEGGGRGHTPYSFTPIALPLWNATFPRRAKWLKQEMDKRGLSIRRLCDDPDAPARNTIFRILRGDGVNARSLEDVRKVLSKHGSDIHPSQIPQS